MLFGGVCDGLYDVIDDGLMVDQWGLMNGGLMALGQASRHVFNMMGDGAIDMK
jgi:hypothetical protein